MADQPLQPPQHQDEQPGRESEMRPQPRAEDPGYKAAGKLAGKIALITGGDSGIGRAVSIAFAKEGADIVSLYLEEHEDMITTQRRVEELGRRYLGVAGDIGREDFCRRAVQIALNEFNRLDILVNNAGEQHPQGDIEKITTKQWRRTFSTNIDAIFFLTRAAVPRLPEGASIINTASVTAYRGHPQLLDYSATKGAIIAFTRSLALMLADKKIRVNAVAPGPIWTPLIPSTFSPQHVESFGGHVPMGRPGQPEEVAPSFVFLASDDASYMTGQVLHPNGGEIING